MNGYEAQLKQLLSEHGWSFYRNGKGSHEIGLKTVKTRKPFPKIANRGI